MLDFHEKILLRKHAEISQNVEASDGAQGSDIGLCQVGTEFLHLQGYITFHHTKTCPKVKYVRINQTINS